MQTLREGGEKRLVENNARDEWVDRVRNKGVEKKQILKVIRKRKILIESRTCKS